MGNPNDPYGSQQPQQPGNLYGSQQQQFNNGNIQQGYPQPQQPIQSNYQQADLQPNYQQQYQQQPYQQQQYPQQQQQYPQQQEPQFQQQQVIMMHQPQQQTFVYSKAQMARGPVQIKCFSCGQVGTSMVKKSSCTLNACLWFLFCGFVGLCSYWICCEQAHEYKHHCINCGALNFTKEAECTPDD